MSPSPATNGRLSMSASCSFAYASSTQRFLAKLGRICEIAASNGHWLQIDFEFLPPMH